MASLKITVETAGENMYLLTALSTRVRGKMTKCLGTGD